ncbi:MAG: 23S rRNA (adenine(2503)-C(2))-methyltransferase RlmN [Bacteroidales bacterium]|nr:23S rRNA (adenine(2503)-C(2))-methyltransferase RlmN [Bacteroidales bacterium]
MEKECVRDLNIEKLIEFCEQNKQQGFRARQISYWLWNKGISDFESMTDLPKPFREALEKAFYFDNIKIESINRSKDKTTKILFASHDNKLFEGVLIPSRDRVTACISTQSGCPLNCSFCSTGKIGFIRNLSVGEIFGQVFELNETCKIDFGRSLTNIVVMGMGEPLLNYENTLEAIKHITAENDLNFSPYRITLSTAGIAPKIKSLADDKIRFNLSISLHSADNKKRSEIMPINKKYDLETLSAAVRYFYEKTGQRITYEYLLLKGINDDIKDAEKLSQFTKISPCKINLIEYNSGDSYIYLPSDAKKTEDFISFLKSKNLVVTLRKSKGQDINAACGQLANKKQ